jgi:L-threonylcarbamoyladenylate synthase
VSVSIRQRHAARILIEGGVIAYPTEGVYGLGCLPDYRESVEHILHIKRRQAGAGLILIAADLALLDSWIDPTPTELDNLQRSLSHPVTWVVTAAPQTPDWLSGGRKTLAVRITRHPVAAGLSRATGSALVSTSANRSGRPPARTALTARRWFRNELDLVVGGALGGLAGPSEIRLAHNDQIIRPAA